MKIYVRERQKVGEGVKQPQFRVVAVLEGQLKVEAVHFRKVEIELIAKDAKADIVYLEPIPDEEKGKYE